MCIQITGISGEKGDSGLVVLGGAWYYTSTKSTQVKQTLGWGGVGGGEAIYKSVVLKF